MPEPKSFRGTLTHAPTPQLLALLRHRGVPEVEVRALRTEDEALDLLEANPPAVQR